MDLTMLKAEEDRLFYDMYESERLKKEQRYRTFAQFTSMTIMS